MFEVVAPALQHVITTEVSLKKTLLQTEAFSAEGVCHCTLYSFTMCVCVAAVYIL